MVNHKELGIIETIDTIGNIIRFLGIVIYYLAIMIGCLIVFALICGFISFMLDYGLIIFLLCVFCPGFAAGLFSAAGDLFKLHK